MPKIAKDKNKTSHYITVFTFPAHAMQQLPLPLTGFSGLIRKHAHGRVGKRD